MINQGYQTSNLQPLTSSLKLKVCGMSDAANVRELVKLSPDYIGFIFYAQSKRFVGEDFDESVISVIPSNILKVGVFVNAEVDYIKQKIKKYNLDLVQLHGDETPDFCRIIKQDGISIIKTFSIDEDFNFKIIDSYKPYCEYFLFDTKSPDYGGAGKKFDWNILLNYDNEKPVFLSGGIDNGDIEEIKKISLKLNIHAIDINSRFELKPGLKDILKIKQFKDNLNLI